MFIYLVGLLPNNKWGIPRTLHSLQIR
jgi:hypothetical protein